MKFRDAAFTGKEFVLHPVQQASVDTVLSTSNNDSANGAFTVPGRTTAVFVIMRGPASEPTTSATEEVSSSASKDSLILVGVIVAFLTAIGVLFAWRRRRTP